MAADELHRRMQGDTPWTEAQREALGIYSSDDYIRINRVLRGDGPPTGHTAEQAREIHGAMRPIPENITVYRSLRWLDAFDVKGNPPDEADLKALVGRSFHDPAPTSTSVKPRPNPRFHLVIKVPAGTRGAYLPSVSEVPHELEMLLDMGTHYKIEGYEQETIDGRPRTTLHLTVVGQDEQPF